MNYVPFTEAIIVMIVELYVKTASHRAVIKGQVLQQIVKVFICVILHIIQIMSNISRTNFKQKFD